LEAHCCSAHSHPECCCNAMVIAMLTRKLTALATIALLLLLPDAALAQLRSSPGAASPPTAAPRPPAATLPTIAPTVRPTPPAAPSPPAGGATPTPTTPPTAQPGSFVPPLQPMSNPVPINTFTGGGSSGGSSLALSPDTSSGSPSQSKPSAPGGGGKSLAD